MLPEYVSGLPLHVLVVHAVVVLLPLTVLGAVVIALWPAARARFGWLVVGVAAVATALVPVATNSGGKLYTRVPESDQIDQHEHLGNQMIYWALPLLVFVVALMVVHEMGRRRQVAWAKLATVAVAVVTVGLAVGAGIHVYRVGDAGSRSVWEFVKDQPPR